MDINIGEQLRTIRTKHQLTQEEVGEHLYLTRQTLSKWEKCPIYWKFNPFEPTIQNQPR